MKLIIITQKIDINDGNLGFFHHWLEKIAGNLEKVYAVCLAEGEHRLPANVIVHSLGKEEGHSKLRQLFLLQKFLFRRLGEADGVFFHMCPIYAILSFPLVKIFRKKTALWFLHRSVTWKLRLAEKCVDKILTASEESCRLKNRKKIRVLGHGIDTELFSAKPQSRNQNFTISSVGRISPVKDQETLVKAIDVLVNQKNIRDIEVKIIGSPVEGYEKEYYERLKKSVKEKGLENYIEFAGSIPNNQMPEYYQKSDLAVNLSHTGSMDKVVLEAMAAACKVLTCNEAFQNILEKKYLFRKKDPRDLAEKIINLRGAGKDASLREIVARNHNLDNLIKKIILEFHG